MNEAPDDAPPPEIESVRIFVGRLLVAADKAADWTGEERSKLTRLAAAVHRGLEGDLERWRAMGKPAGLDP